MNASPEPAFLVTASVLSVCRALFSHLPGLKAEAREHLMVMETSYQIEGKVDYSSSWLVLEDELLERA